MFMSCLMDADSSSFVASGVVLFCFFLPLNPKDLCAALAFFNHFLPQSIHVNRRKLESDDSESLATCKMLPYKQACFPKRHGIWQVKSLCALALDERVRVLLESVLHK